MAGLERSGTSFRRQGSSGLVWDDKFLSGELKKAEDGSSSRELKPIKTRHGRSNREGAYQTVKNVSPALDPPSPKVSGCCVCSIFERTSPTPKPKPVRRTL